MVDYWTRLVLRLRTILAGLDIPIDLPDPTNSSPLEATKVLTHTLDLLEEEDGPMRAMLSTIRARYLRRTVVWLLDSQSKIVHAMRAEARGRKPRRWEQEALRLALRRAHAYLDELEKVSH